MTQLIFYANKKNSVCKQIQPSTPIASGNSADISVVRTERVSFQTVKSVVAQGRWKSKKNSMQSAVCTVQWLASKVSAKGAVPPYMASNEGRSSSFAGKASKKASRMAPSSPIKAPNGCKNACAWSSSVSSAISIRPASQMSAPAGAATSTALPSIGRIRSKRERVRICPG